jgi:hypothetical protein
VRVNDIGKSYLRLEDYFKNGSPDPPEDQSLDYETLEDDGASEAALWARRAAKGDKS